MTSSSSANSCNSCTDGARERELAYHGDHQPSLHLNNGKQYFILDAGASTKITFSEICPVKSLTNLPFEGQ